MNSRLFGLLRIILGIAYLSVPAYPLFSGTFPEGDDRNRIYFTFLFFLVYSYSAIVNGLREIRKTEPAFNLLRFFELAMNGFISLYLVILFATSGANLSFRIILLLASIIIMISTVRDARIIGVQYRAKKAEAKRKT